MLKKFTKNPLSVLRTPSSIAFFSTQIRMCSLSKKKKNVIVSQVRRSYLLLLRYIHIFSVFSSFYLFPSKIVVVHHTHLS